MSIGYPSIAPSLALRGAGRRWIERGAPIALPTFLYGATLGAFVVGYYAYWLLWKLKAIYVGWAVALAVAMAFALLQSRDTRGLIRSLLPLAVWEAYLVASTFWAPDQQSSLYFVAARILFPAAFIIGYIWLRNLTMWQLSSFLPVIAWLQLPITLWTLITIGQLYDESLGAVRTGLAMVTLFAVPFLVWRARNRPKWSRYAWIGLAMLILAASGSRTGAILGAFILIATLTFVQPPKGRKMRSLTVAVAALGTLAAIGVFVPQVRAGASDALDKLTKQTAWGWSAWTREEFFLTESGEQPADRDRRLQMLVAFGSFRTHPLRGNGYYSTYSITDEMLGIPIGAHGLVSLLLGETGLIGTGIFIAMMGIFFHRVRRAVKLADTPAKRGFWETCLWSMVAMLLMGLFHQVDQTAAFYVLLSWGLAAGYPGTRVETDQVISAA